MDDIKILLKVNVYIATFKWTVLRNGYSFWVLLKINMLINIMNMFISNLENRGNDQQQQQKSACNQYDTYILCIPSWKYHQISQNIQ